MPGIDITGKANIEATVTTKWDDNSFQKQTEQYPPFQEMQNEQGAENLQSLNETINNNTDSFKGNTAIMKEFGDVMPDIINSLRHMNSVVAQTASSLPAIKKTFTDEERRKAQLDEYRRKNFFGLLDIGNGTINSLSSGNVGGAGIGLVSGAGNTVSNLSNMAKVKDLEGLSKGLLATSGVLLAGAALAKGGKALADSYKEAMPTIFGTGKAFGTTDDAESMRLYKTVNRYNRDTGLDIESFNSVVQSLRKQGIGNEYKNRNNQAIAASQIAETTAQWAYATGGDANQYANLAGVMSRYGGSKNVAEDFNYLVAAGKASGLNDVQIPEFLSGIQKVMEDGIAKGFTRSSTEVAQTLTMFSKMSGGNAFWQGEQGAKLLNQMNSGVASATSLAKTSDILTYQAFRSVYNNDKAVEEELNKDNTFIKGGGYVNMMQLIEQGVNADNFSAIMKAAKNASGGDVNAETEFLRDIFGLNYTGVGKLKNLDLTGMTKDEADKAIKDALADPKNQNKETAWQTSLNQIAEALQSGGEKLFALELKGVNEIARDVNKIANWVTNGRNTKEDAAQNNPVDNPMYTPENKEFSEEYNEKKEEVNTKALENFDAGQKVLLNDYTQQYWGNDPNGEHFEEAYNFVENYDSVNQLWEQSRPVIVKRTKGVGLTEKARQADLENNPYQLADWATEKDVDPLTLILSKPETHNKYASLLAGGKVSPQVFMSAITNSKEMSDTVRGATNLFDRDYSTKDLDKINNTLEKIFSELASGVTYTENK